ncbi:MAG TPA: hypothetical protein DCY56_04785 [Candidatus Omnitrophica bacterium]|nr:hypothetical protein [Candidatus Omnitrophota bacterium]
MSVINVLHIIETLEPGGAEGLLVHILKNLDRNRFSPKVVCLFNQTALKTELDKAGIPVFCIHMKNPYGWWNAIISLYKLIKREKTNIVHTHLFFANIYGRIAARMAGVRTIFTTLHNPDYTYEDNGRLTYKIRKIIDRYSGRICNTDFIAVSNFVKKDFEKQLGFKNIKVLYNCIEPSIFRPMSKDDANCKRLELGFKEDDLVLINIGRLHPQKGQLCLIEAFKLLNKSAENCKLIILGKGHMEPELRRKVEEYNLGDQVIFLKDRADVPSILVACNIFVFPSIYEGFGIALIEAMASGLAIVASNIESLREIIDDARNGILIEKENHMKLAEAISMLIKDEKMRLSLGEMARKKAFEMFGIKEYVKKLEALYMKEAFV